MKGEDRPLVCDEKTNVEVDDKVVRICGRVEASRSMSRSSPGSGSDLGCGGDRELRAAGLGKDLSSKSVFFRVV